MGYVGRQKRKKRIKGKDALLSMRPPRLLLLLLGMLLMLKKPGLEVRRIEEIRQRRMPRGIAIVSWKAVLRLQKIECI